MLVLGLWRYPKPNLLGKKLGAHAAQFRFENMVVHGRIKHTLYQTQVNIGVLKIFVNQMISWCMPLERVPCKRLAHNAGVASAPPPQLGALVPIPGKIFLLSPGEASLIFGMCLLALHALENALID